MSAYDFEPEPDAYWESELVNDRDEYDQHLRAVEDAERERIESHE